jgi:hypothetical protein
MPSQFSSAAVTGTARSMLVHRSHALARNASTWVRG